MRTENMYGINNKRIDEVSMYVTTCVTHKPEMCIDLLTFSVQIGNNFALEPYSKSGQLCLDLLKFHYEDLEEIVTVGQGSFGVYGSRYIITKFAVEGHSPPHGLQKILGNLSELVTPPKKKSIKPLLHAETFD